MNNHRILNRTRFAISLPVLLLACAMRLTTLAEDSRASARVQLNADDHQVQAGASLVLSATTPAGTASAGVAADAKVDRGEGSSDGSDGDSKDKGDDKEKKGGGSGTAPVPEPATWLGLGTLLAIGFGLAALERKTKN